MDTWLKDSSRLAPPDAAWHQHRLNLFTTYCVPTVLAQTVSNFQWLIYCDSKTGSEQLLELKGTLPDSSRILLRFIDDKSDLLADLRTLILQSSTPYVITSRLDNDDGLGEDYIQQVQSHFEERNRLLINFQGGAFYDPKHHILTQSKTTVSNSFSSLIEKRDAAEELLTVYGFHHTDLPANALLQQVKGGFHWLKIIHDRNLKSQMKGRPLFKWPAKAFASLDITRLEISWAHSLAYVFRRQWQRMKN